MSHTLNIQDFVAEMPSKVVLDVRTPAEYADGHIPGALNMPLFSNEERALIGTLYKKEGQQKAILQGLDLVGPRMRTLITGAEKIAPKKEALIHCWRGGMRSGSVSWLLSLYGFKVGVLKGGYKAFRNWVLSSFQLERTIIILGGSTGSGKTRILHKLAEAGEQVIDLEALAHHKGSAFGALGESNTTQEQFENELAIQWNALDPSRPVWLEDESRTIGRKVIPAVLWEKMQHANVIVLDIDFEDRIRNLVLEYGKYPKEELAASILKIRKRLGGLTFQQALEALDNGDLAGTARILLGYYDKAYRGLEKRDPGTIYKYSAATADENEIARQVIALCKTINV